MARRGLDVAHLAAAAGIARASVYRLLNGEGCTLHTACAVADALGVGIDALRAQPGSYASRWRRQQREMAELLLSYQARPVREARGKKA
jgi:inosine/xanthosine triphosphate pyrophosphatase family protein